MEKRIYFKNLNGLRFFAAFAVILHHIEQYKYWAGIPSIWGGTTIDALGYKAVSFFFVLSGFLITYLLLEEYKKTNDISIRSFYVRRILRIWPLYYLIVAICLLVVPAFLDLSFFNNRLYDENFHYKVIFLLLIFPNLLRGFSPNTIGGNQLWSIGVEEQFYIIWPVLVRTFINRMVPFLILFMVIKVAITVLLGYVADVSEYKIYATIYNVWVLFKVEQMAIGALAAWVLFTNQERIIRVLYHPVTWYASLFMMAGLLFEASHNWMMNYVEAVIFSVVILNLSTNPAVKVSFETPLLNRLGNVSYGIYMFHTFCIATSLYFLAKLNIEKESPVLFNILLYSLSVTLTIVLSFISYEYFEKFFLGLKERFMIVKSGTTKSKAVKIESEVSG